MYSDHENLVTLFRPDTCNPELSKSALDKVYRWCYTLSRFRINHMEHLPGQRNLWADLLSRWAHPTYKEEKEMFQLRSVCWKRFERRILKATAGRKKTKITPAKLQAKGKKKSKSTPAKADVNPSNGRKKAKKRKAPEEKTPVIPGSKRKRLTKKEEEERRARGREWNKFLNLEFQVRMEDKELPGLPQILEAQRNLSDKDVEFKRANANHFKTNEDGVLTYKGLVWIPEEARELQLYAMIMAHCGFAGHRGSGPTSAKIKKWGYWQKWDEDVKDFCSQCRLCEKTKTGETIPRPWGQSVSGSKPGEVVHFDYMYIAPPKDNWDHKYKYVLVLKDDYSGMVDLWPAETCDHTVVVHALQHWESIMGRAKVLVSDRGSHFKNQVLEEYVKHSKVLYNPLRPNVEAGEGESVPQRHHFTTAYCPWANGTVENVNKHLKALLVMLTKEARIDWKDWPAMLSVIAGVLNSSESYRNLGYTPRQLFMGPGKADNPLNVIYNQRTTTISHLEKSKEEYDKDFKDLMEALEVMHRKVDEKREHIYDRNYWGKLMAKRGEDSKAVSDRDRLVDFAVGDFVMVATPRALPSKLVARWSGPYEVVRCVDDYVYEVKHLVTGHLMEAHIMRIKFFCNSELNKSISLMDEITSHENHDLLFVAEEVEDFRRDDRLDASYVKMKWLGFSKLESTWELVEDMAQTFPELLERYFKSIEGMKHAKYNPLM